VKLIPAGTLLRKILIRNRLLYRPLNEAMGGLREDFFVETFKALGKEIFYLKSTLGKKTPDFLIRDSEDIVLEVGGKGKEESQFKGVGVKKKLFLRMGMIQADRRPLFLAGLIK